MRVHTEKQVVYLRQKQGRNTHPKRSVDILWEECNKAKTRQRYTPREKGLGCLLEGRGTQ